MRDEKNTMAVEKTVKAFFGKNLVSCDVTTHGRLVDIDVVYRDFIPVSDARYWLDQHIPFLWSMDVERVYSDSVTLAALQCLYDQDCSVREKVEELLFTEDLRREEKCDDDVGDREDEHGG